MSSLFDQINFLANGLVEGILDAVRGTSLTELGDAPEVNHRPLSVREFKYGKTVAATLSGRLPRRSPADLEKVVGLVVGALGKAKTGLRSEQLQEALSLSKKEIVGPLTIALSTKKIVKKGQKRATTYFVKTAKAVKKAAVKIRPVAKAKAKKKLAKKALKSSKKK
jgi:hypothetical protein